jgi:hypothetical protein
MMDVATGSVKARKQAAEIQKLVSEGKLNPADVDLLAKNGVDPAAVKYWKEFFGEVGPEGKEFATELVKEHVKAQVEEEMGTYRVKIARAYELAYEMVDRELLPRTRDAISTQVDQIMKWKVIASSPIQKSAGRMPQVGLYNPSEDATPTAGPTDSLKALFDEAFAKSSSSKRMF